MFWSLLRKLLAVSVMTEIKSFRKIDLVTCLELAAHFGKELAKVRA